MKVKLVDGTVLEATRLQCNYGNSFGGRVFDTIQIAKDEVLRIGFDKIAEAFRPDNISTVVFSCLDGTEFTRSYKFISENRCIIGDTINLFTVSLTNEITSSGDANEE